MPSMSARWSVLLGLVAGLAASGAAGGASVSTTSGRISADPAGEVAGGAKGRKGHPPRYRYMFSSESAQGVVAAHGWNLLDVSSQSSADQLPGDRKSTRLNSSHGYISYAVFCLKKKKSKSL